MYNKYPYTDFHEMNDDWIINTVKEYTEKYNDIDQAIVDNLSEILLEWKDDGTLSDIINQTVFNSLYTQINNETSNRLAADNNLAAYLALLGYGFESCTVITVGQGSNYDYNDIVSAVEYANSLTDVPVIIAVYRGNWSTTSSANPYGLTLENNKILYGMGSRQSVNIAGSFTSSETTKSTLCLKDSCAIFNCFINGSGGKYTIHDDFHNEGDSIPQYRYICNCEIYGQSMASGNTYGAGIKSNQHVKIEKSLIYSFDNLPIRFHNWTNCEQDSFIELIDTTLHAAQGYNGLRLSVLNNYNGYTNYKPVWVEIKNCELPGIIIQAEANNPTVNIFKLSCDDIYPIRCDVGTLDVGPECSPIKMLHTTVPGSLMNKCVCHSGEINYYTGFGGGNDCAVIGVGYDQTHIAIAGCVYGWSFGLTLTTHDTITIAQDGSLEVNGNGRVVGFKDASGYLHFDFRM